MGKLLVVLLAGALPMAALAESWVDVPLIDRTCADVAKSKPDGHPTDCLLQCASAGLGILDHGTWVALDHDGNEKAVAALKATHKRDHVRLNVTGEREGSVIHVTSLTIPE